MKIRMLVILMLACAGSSCTREATGVVQLSIAGAANANVTLAADGSHVAAAWAATGEDGTDIYVARSTDGGPSFGAPSRVDDIAGDASVNGEAPPRVLLAGHRVEVVWVSKRGGVAGIRTAESTDDGRTFAPARTVTAEGVSGARGWQTAAIADDGTVHAAWLDGRNAVHAAPAQAAGGAAAGGAHVHQIVMRQDIYHAMWRGGESRLETEIAANVCFCS